MATARTVTTDGEPARPTRIEVALADGRARLATLAQGNLVAARPLEIAGRYVRLALVGINTALLAGDRLELQVRVGKDAVLEVIEPTGLVAYNAEGLRATWRLNAIVGVGAALIWHGAPFIAAQGSNVHRLTEVALEGNARALVKETLVLGRSGESDVRLHSRNDVSLNGEPLLVEDLAIDEKTATLPGIVAPARVIGTVMAAGWRPLGDTASPHRFDLAGPGALFRSLERAVHHADELVDPPFRDWRNQVLRREACSGERKQPHAP